MYFPSEFWYSIAIIHSSWFHNMNSPIYNCRFSCCMLCVLFTALCNGETWIYFKCSWFLWKKSKEYARCVLNFCIVTYFGITTYLVYVCYMIVAIKPMYFVMYKIIYFCWKTFLWNHNIVTLNICITTTTCIHPPHEIFFFQSF